MTVKDLAEALGMFSPDDEISIVCDYGNSMQIAVEPESVVNDASHLRDLGWTEDGRYWLSPEVNA